MRHAVPLRVLVAFVLAATAAARRAPAQGTSSARPGSDDDAVCFAFAFGAWSPPLDWRAAGHGDRPDSTRLAHAPAGRDWAAETSSPRDTVLMLFPAWWPVGVMVEIPARRIVNGDTVTGHASALVADGRLRAPTATVRAWRVPCGGARPVTPAAPSARDGVRADSTAAARRVGLPDDSAAHARPRPDAKPARPID